MAAVNYYVGLQRGQVGKIGQVVNGVASNGTGSDVELRIQINNGTNATGITRHDVLLALDVLRQYIAGAGVPPTSNPEYLPVL
jgi:hypothetical protein